MKRWRSTGWTIWMSWSAHDEDSTCRSAVLEGQAMIVLLDYVLAPQGRAWQKMPQIVDMMQASMDKSRGSPVFDSAPVASCRKSWRFPIARA